MSIELPNWRDRPEDNALREAIHDRVLPADVRKQERVATRLRPQNSNNGFLSTKTWRISPFGVEVLVDSSNALSVGLSLDLEIVVAGERTRFSGIVVAEQPHSPVEHLVGIRFFRTHDESPNGEERRRSVRWLCSSQFYPTGIAPSPLYFDDWIFLQVHDISSAGMRLVTSLRNKYLLTGLHLQITFAFPAGGTASVRARIERISIGSYASEDRLIVGVSYTELDNKSRAVIGQYLLQFGDTDAIDSFREAGFISHSILRSVTLGYIRDEPDYRAVLRLRHSANLSAGQLSTSTDKYTDLAEREDSSSRILVAKHKGNIVATLRVRFPTREDPPEADAHAGWPASLPRAEQLLECSRLAIDPNFRGGDLLAGLMRYVSLTCLSTDRRYITMSVMRKFVPFYRKAGFTQTELSYHDPRWSEPLYVMIIDAAEGVRGKGVNPFYWGLMWKDLATEMVSSGLVSVSGLDQARMAFFRTLSPLSSTLVRLARFLRTRASNS